VESGTNVGVGDPKSNRSPTKLPVASADSTAPQLKASIDSEFSREQALMGIQLEIESLGVPDLMPGMVIDVDGLSARYKGVYAITDLTHTWSGSGASTKFTCFSNTQRIFQQMLAAAGPVNAQQAKTAEQASTVTATPKAQ
jgi:phage protein D